MEVSFSRPCNSSRYCELVGLVVSLRVFVPVSNLGFARLLGLGILKQDFMFPRVSVINHTFDTVA